MGKNIKRKTRAKSNKRAQNAFEIAQQQERARNGDSDSSDDDGAIINPRKRFGNEDGEDNNSNSEFEDEELDSDEALGSDDDFDILNTKFSQTIRDKQKKIKKGQIEEGDDDEDEGYQSVDESQLLPLSAVWDLDDKDLINSKDTKDVILDDNWQSESESEDETSDESEDEEEEFPFENQSGDEDEDEVELTNLKNQLTKKDKRTKSQYQDLHIQENELALPGGGNEITLADMLSVVDNDASKKAMLIDKEETEESGKSLAIPLPKRIQDRHERKAAYEISKDEVNKWKETVKQNRESEVLSFPMNKQIEHNAPSTFQETPALTDLEQKVNSVLNESSLLDDKKESTFEEIATAKMSVDELRKRQNELRKMRELMFRNEREAKRIKKIKSRSYRRIKKKEMLKNKSLIEGEESDDDEHDSKRAQERMSLKHKNNSAWSRSMIKSGLSKDQEAREEMEEMLRRGESLKSKILDRDEDEDEFGDSNDLNLDKDVDYDSETEARENLGKTGVLNMAFMKNAEARERTRNEETKNNLRRLHENEDIEEFDESERNNAINVHINPGRRIYTPGSGKSNAEMKEFSQTVLDEDEIDNSKNLTARLSKSDKKQDSLLNREAEKQKISTKENADEDESNPWLTVSNNVQKSRKIHVTDKESSKLEKKASKMSKQRKRKAKEIEEPEEIIDDNETLKIVDPHGDDSDAGSHVDASKIHMFKQQDLIKQAFAGDDVVEEFEAEKRQVIRDEGDQVEDLTLPGWGDWAGGKNKKPKKNKIVKRTKGVDFDKRKDKNLKNVIINEKVNKKNAKYQSSAVPFPFESREQYERSLRMPIGQEWTSRETHQRLTMPKVTIKSGVVIDPLKAPFK